MLICPNCQTQNESGSRFCISCGQDLSRESESSSTALAHTGLHQRHLALATGRFLITLLLIWLLRSVFVNLSFVEALRVPEIPFTIAQIVTFIAYLAAFALLISYAGTLRSHWPQAFPRAAFLTPVMTVIIYVILISFAYRALLPVFSNLVADPTDFVLVLRVVLALLALVLLGWAGKVVYDGLPGWLSGIRFSSPQEVSGEVACLNCGRLNTVTMQYCGHCGQDLKEQKGTTPENE